jgi:hypothetical protein
MGAELADPPQTMAKPPEDTPPKGKWPANWPTVILCGFLVLLMYALSTGPVVGGSGTFELENPLGGHASRHSMRRSIGLRSHATSQADGCVYSSMSDVEEEIGMNGIGPQAGNS